jgi:hypothetical protein
MLSSIWGFVLAKICCRLSENIHNEEEIALSLRSHPTGILD